MSTMFADTILIVFISVCTALLAEGEQMFAEWKQSLIFAYKLETGTLA